MPAVLVHGVPDTHRLWDSLARCLSRTDVVAIRLPGFGCPVPASFNATKEAYVDWLIGQLDDLGEPVDPQIISLGEGALDVHPAR